MTARVRWVAGVMGLAAAWPLAAGAQGHAGHGGSGAGAPASVRVTMDALHAAGGVPAGWRFALPAGDPVAGRQAFVDLACFACHTVKGEQFPLKPGETATAGPDLTGMASHHPLDYLVESIVNPSAVLVEGPGYIGGDGRSIMPEYPQMTVAQLTNLVAYLRSLTAASGAAPAATVREQTGGGYRVRLVQRPAPAAAHAHHGHAGHGGSREAGASGPRLMAFVAAADSGQAVPYLPMSVRIEVPGKGARSVPLVPTLGPEGFHYGADIAIPADTRRIVLSIGVPAMRLLPGGSPGLGRAQSIAFDWKASP